MPAGVVNFAWLVADKGVRLVVSVTVGMLLARYLGPERFGLLNYAFAVVALALPLAELGLDALLRRRLIATPDDGGGVLAAAWCMRMASGLVLYMCLAVAVGFAPDGSDAGLLLLIAGLALLQPAWATADGWLQANLQARVAVIMNWIVLGSGAVVRLILIARSAEVEAFAWVTVSEGICTGVLLWRGARRAGMPKLMPVDFVRTVRGLIKDAWPLMLTGVTVSLYMRVDVVMLKVLSSERETGLYSAAVKLSEFWYFVPVALASSVLPWMLKQRQAGGGAYDEAVQRYYNMNALLAYGMAGATTLCAKPLVGLIYGAEFSGAAPVLALHSWAAVWVFLGVARSQFLINENRMVFGLLTTGLGAVVNLGLNWWWIPANGSIGAAWATLVAYGVAGWGATWMHPAVRPNAWMQTKALLTPWRVFGRSSR